MEKQTGRIEGRYDVIIIGGSYAGLSAAMSLGRALKKVLVIDSGKPCNASTPFSHNFLTNDGRQPAAIASQAREQVKNYASIHWQEGEVIHAHRLAGGFEVSLMTGEKYQATRLVFATGIRDILPEIEGLRACWGKSVLHCPFCHGYEVRGKKTGVMLNNERTYDFTKMIYNWTKDLVLLTNGPSNLSTEQQNQLQKHGIGIMEKKIRGLQQENGQVREVLFEDGSSLDLEVLYAPSPFEQHSSLPAELGCVLTADGYIHVDEQYETTVKGVYAIGDNASRMRTVANAVAMGNLAGIGLVRKMVEEGEMG